MSGENVLRTVACMQCGASCYGYGARARDRWAVQCFGVPWEALTLDCGKLRQAHILLKQLPVASGVCAPCRRR
jgi:hypothetical protein